MTVLVYTFMKYFQTACSAFIHIKRNNTSQNLHTRPILIHNLAVFFFKCVTLLCQDTKQKKKIVIMVLWLNEGVCGGRGEEEDSVRVCVREGRGGRMGEWGGELGGSVWPTKRR